MDDKLLPVRMLNEYAYCPRLFHLMHVEGRWQDNAFTVEGKSTHRRVDELDHVLPDADADANADALASRGKRTGGVVESRAGLFPQDSDAPPVVSRSVPLASDTLGITAKLDLVSSDGRDALPVETKRGRVPDNLEQSWEPERVQLMAQGLLLREAGYDVDRGVLYFAGSRTRVVVPFTPELEARTRDLIGQARRAMSLTVLPDPLEDSPKCRGCSLNAICLPDETLALQYRPSRDGDVSAEGEDASAGASGVEARKDVRRLYPVRDDATPFYVQEPAARVGTSRGSIVVTREKEKIASTRLNDTSQLVLCGPVQITTQAIHILAEAGIPVAYLSGGHWFYALTFGMGLRNAYDRAAQFDAARDKGKCLYLAKRLVLDKATNQRTLLRRNASQDAGLSKALRDLDELAARVNGVDTLESLLGLEGALAAAYFSQFAKLVKPRDFDAAAFDFTTRNRRPPTDPVNAMLSFGYALLAKEFTVALMAEGLDPWWGFYHQPRHGRPALALDLMEPFRPAVVDSAVITAINTGMVAAGDFARSKSACIMQPAARKALIRAYESRLDTLITHPVFDYRCSWRVMVRLQCRLLARWLRGDVPDYVTVTTR